MPSVTTHLHNGHTPLESDGFPCFFMEPGQFYDHHYPNVLAGVNSTHISQGGDIQEAMHTLWYHDHRIDHTAENTYKGLAGTYILFNEHDTGDENTGFKLPSFGDGQNPLTSFDIYSKLVGDCEDPNDIRFAIKRNTVEKWIFRNNSGGWQHPIHMHFEEFQTLLINNQPPANSGLITKGRKDVFRLETNMQATVYFRFRDFIGKFPLHCHNVVHEDHQMMVLGQINDVGDNKTQP